MKNKTFRDSTVQTLRKANELVSGYFNAVSHDTDQKYRRFFFSSDVTQTRIVLSVLALTVGLFAVSDYMFFGFSVIFYALSALRIGLIGYTAYYIKVLGKVKNHHFYDLTLLIYLLILVGGILLVNLTRPENLLPHILIIDLAIFVFYLIIPTRFIFQAIPALTFSIGEVLIITVFFELWMAPAVFTALYSLLFVNIVAALSSLQIHSYRWRIYQNIAEREETERLAAIGQTAGMIGHDIRNPLQAIVSELYLARESIANYPPPLHDEAVESVSLIEQQTDYISKIVSDLQDYARPLKPEYAEVDFTELVISMFQAVRVPDSIKLEINVAGLPKIKTDPTLLRRALTNLINNAVQAMPKGGILGLSAVRVDGQTVISVSDTGQGIPREVRAKLFTPLVTSKAKGQGLGLAVVKRIIEALNGSITFETQENVGTKFIITLLD